MSGETLDCSDHDWSWDYSDTTGCPVCEGIRIGTEQILTLLDELEEQYYDSRPTTQLALHPFKEAKRKIEKLLDN